MHLSKCMTHRPAAESVAKAVARSTTPVHARHHTRVSPGAASLLPTLHTHVQIQQQPQGTYSYQEHFQRTGAAIAVPVCAVLLHWLLGFWMDVQQRRDTKKLQRLEATQKTMLKELKVLGVLRGWEGGREA